MNTMPAYSQTRGEGGRPTAARGTCDVTIVLPVFNEEKNIRRLLERIDQDMRRESLVYRIVAVEDGSTDGTGAILAECASSMRIAVVKHRKNQGLGVAIRDGLVEAVRCSPRDGIVVTMDADESHTPALIARMLDAVGAGFDVVIASRYQPGSRCVGVPLYRQALSLAASAVFRTVFPTRGVKDFTCGYRAYRTAALTAAIEAYGPRLFEHDGFECMVDLLLKLRSRGCRFAEVPAILRYDLKEGASKMRVFRTATRTLRLLALRRLGR